MSDLEGKDCENMAILARFGKRLTACANAS